MAAKTVIHGPRSTEKMTYEDALFYCFWFSYEGRKGWRLPTFYEYIDGEAWFKDAEITKRKYYCRPVKDIVK